jgi:hypothetical protein
VVAEGVAFTAVVEADSTPAAASVAAVTVVVAVMATAEGATTVAGTGGDTTVAAATMAAGAEAMVGVAVMAGLATAGVDIGATRVTGGDTVGHIGASVGDGDIPIMVTDTPATIHTTVVRRATRALITETMVAIRHRLRIPPIPMAARIRESIRGDLQLHPRQRERLQTTRITTDRRMNSGHQSFPSIT